jgi:hypothetical protein
VIAAAAAVFVTRNPPSYAQPWQTTKQRGALGSAFVIDADKRYILTNAHVVRHYVTIHVRRPGIAKKWKASLLCEAMACDLALLTVGALPVLPACSCNSHRRAESISACLCVAFYACLNAPGRGVAAGAYENYAAFAIIPALDCDHQRTHTLLILHTSAVFSMSSGRAMCGPALQRMTSSGGASLASRG